MSDYSLKEALAAADNTTEESFVIDSDLRTIQGPQKYVLGVFNDQNVQTVHFKCPRHYNGIDLSTFSIKINYMNASKKYDMSLVKNIKIADDYMTFDWLTSKNVFISPGTVTFNVCLTKVDDDSNITNEFNTTIYRLDVLEGLEVTMSEPEESAVKDFLAYINNTREHIDSISESVASDKNSVSEMKDAVTLLKDNAKAEADRATESSTSAKVQAEKAKAEADRATESSTSAKVQAEKAKEEADRATESSTSAKVQAEKAKASADSVANVVSDVSKLKEDLPNKITKFYASNQGETHINDSDNGNIQDMMIYGKSSQDGTPTPENPVEINSVVNPTIKVCGKNLLPPNLRYGGRVKMTIKKGVTLTLLCKNGLVSIGGNLKFEDENGERVWFGIDEGNAKQQTTLQKDVFACNYLISEPSEKYALYIGDGNTYEPYKEQSTQLPITLNAIPVSSGGNVTINGQQYIADYVDVERGKVVRMCRRKALNTKNGEIDEEYRIRIRLDIPANQGDNECIFSTFKWTSWETCVAGDLVYLKNIKKPNNELYTAQELKELSLDFEVVYQLAEKQETDLTTEQIQALKELATYYPVTNISANSEQLDGYTVFNYPISIANGWNYVKQQLNDNRDYIYDMDLQSAEAYVNSEYAVTLTELGV